MLDVDSCILFNTPLFAKASTRAWVHKHRGAATLLNAPPSMACAAVRLLQLLVSQATFTRATHLQKSGMPYWDRMETATKSGLLFGSAVGAVRGSWGVRTCLLASMSLLASD